MDPTLDKKRRDLILEAAKKLDLCQMVRFAENSETLSMTDLGRIASYYYIEHESIRMYLTYHNHLFLFIVLLYMFPVPSTSPLFQGILTTD
jgi:hypothetical protein